MRKEGRSGAARNASASAPAQPGSSPAAPQFRHFPGRRSPGAGRRPAGRVPTNPIPGREQGNSGGSWSASRCVRTQAGPLLGLLVGAEHHMMREDARPPAMVVDGRLAREDREIAQPLADPRRWRPHRGLGFPSAAVAVESLRFCSRSWTSVRRDVGRPGKDRAVALHPYDQAGRHRRIEQLLAHRDTSAWPFAVPSLFRRTQGINPGSERLRA